MDVYVKFVLDGDGDYIMAGVFTQPVEHEDGIVIRLETDRHVKHTTLKLIKLRFEYGQEGDRVFIADDLYGDSK